MIINEILQMIEPGWRVLDVGSATGVLSIPMATIGCSVTALDPSEYMNTILLKKLQSFSLKNIEIYNERWEDFNEQDQYSFDLVVACNSLHLTEGGIKGGMNKVFTSLPRYACLITGINQGIFIDFKDIDRLQNEYNFLYIKNYAVDSGFCFKSMDEVQKLSDLLNYKIDVTEDNNGIVQHDKADIAVLWWERK